MPDFTYIARNGAGQQIEGILSAGTEREVIASLAARQLFPLRVSTAAKRAVVIGSPKVKSRAVVPVYSQLAALLRSGVPLLRSLQVLREQSSNKALAEVLRDVETRISEGSTLAEAMGRHPRAFNELAVSIIRAGGEGGFLEEALDRVAAFTEQQDELKSRVIGALAYPMILCVLGTVIVGGLLIFVVPKFEEMFDGLREIGELPAVTDLLLGLSRTLKSYGLFILGGLVLLGFILKGRLATDAGRHWVDRWRIRIPQVGAIYLSLAVARFCRVLGTLLKGGVPIVKSLEIAADSTGNVVLAESVAEAAENITGGKSLAEPLGASGHFPRNVVEMIAVAEQSNSLESVLTQIADSLEKETWRKLDLFVRLLEPLMLIVLAGIVLVVVIALLLPVLKMSMTV